MEFALAHDAQGRGAGPVDGHVEHEFALIAGSCKLDRAEIDTAFLTHHRPDPLGLRGDRCHPVVAENVRGRS
jgi:hypothetical protein